MMLLNTCLIFDRLGTGESMTMAVTSTPRGPAAELYSGDRMSRAEFHPLYKQMPEDFKAELIGGTVYVASPLKLKHGTSHPWLSAQ